ncbi:MAG: nucleotide exchange factor GrpE [Lachnospiraceae bacterium]|nr:nucleotide exchange factor GrpE [Lachnospiraceae bacterium]
MAETENKQDQEIDQNMTDGTDEQTGQTDAKQAQTGQTEGAAGADEPVNEEAVKAGAQAEAAQEDGLEAGAGNTAQTDSGSDDAGAADANDSTSPDTNGTAGSGETASATKEKKSFFSKKDKNKEKDKDKERIAELEDRVMRQMAEFENFRRRSEKEKQQMFETGARSVIEKILPVVDNFERGLSSIPEAERQGAVAEGMNMIYKQLQTELDNIGVKAIDAVGQEFDPAKHNAVMQVTSEEYESGIVAQELQKGYTYRDTVIRHSMVAVVE